MEAIVKTYSRQKYTCKLKYQLIDDSNKVTRNTDCSKYLLFRVKIRSYKEKIVEVFLCIFCKCCDTNSFYCFFEMFLACTTVWIQKLINKFFENIHSICWSPKGFPPMMALKTKYKKHLESLENIIFLCFLSDDPSIKSFK